MACLAEGQEQGTMGSGNHGSRESWEQGTMGAGDHGSREPWLPSRKEKHG